MGPNNQMKGYKEMILDTREFIPTPSEDDEPSDVENALQKRNSIFSTGKIKGKFLFSVYFAHEKILHCKTAKTSISDSTVQPELDEPGMVCEKFLSKMNYWYCLKVYAKISYIHTFP
jgi:hypothetical protein